MINTKDMMKHILLLSTWFLTLTAFAQTPPDIQWAVSLGGATDEEGQAVAQTSDGGYIIAGAQQNGTNGWDYYLVKVDADGGSQWARTYGGSGFDKAFDVQPTSEGGYVLVGFSTSMNGDVTGNHGGADYWVVKLDASGAVEWQKSLGGAGGDLGNSIAQTSDDGYVVTGSSASMDGDVSGNHGQFDAWVVKLDANGSIQWERSYGGSGEESGACIRPVADGGYVLAGSTNSTDGDVTNPLGDSDTWIVKLDGSGDLIWERSFGGAGSDGASDVRQTADGGYVVSGSTNSTDGDVTIAHGGDDVWLVRLDGIGTLQWQKSLGGTGTDVAYAIEEASGGGHVVAAITSSNNGDVTGFHGGFYDYWVVRVDATGALIWQKALGGSADDRAVAIKRTTEGGYVVAGFSNSNDGDVTSAFPGYNVWVVKLETDNVSIFEPEPELELTLFPNPTDGDMVVNYTLDVFAQVRLAIQDASGRTVAVLADERQPPGPHMLHYSAKDLPGGFYHLVVIVDDLVAMRKLVKM